MKRDITYFVAIGLHVLIGLLIYMNEFLAKPYFWIAFVYFTSKIILVPNNQKTVTVLKACAYFVGAEVFFRMTKGGISYEIGKYLVIVFCMMGVFYKGLSGKAYPYFFYMLLLVPSIFVASTTLSYDANFRTNIAFVLSGPVCLGVAALFCYDKKVTMKDISSILLFLLLPLIAHLAYIYIYNPSIKEVLDNTTSNRSTSGGWGANQVSTVLGLGSVILAIRIFTKSPSLKYKVFNLILFILISYRAVVTFSRGGVVTAILTVVAFLTIYYLQARRQKRNEIFVTLFVFFGAILFTWILSSTTSDGYIDLRYANKDHLGREKGDVTTGRGDLFIEELEGFITNPFFGIGSSRAEDQRMEVVGQGQSSHNEMSRTLAEHGLLGVAMILILVIKPLDFRTQNKRNYYFYAFLCFWFATVNHSSMRIAAPAFIYGLTLLNVTYEKTSIHRKQLKV